ncbi:MAG: polysaccharide pyruvyl transferase family protein [Pseudomonadota bacterium]
MDLLYYATPEGNFGDDLNTWIWDDLIPGWRDWEADAVLVGVGTVLKRGFVPEGQKKLVLGSGVGYGTQPDLGDGSDWDIRAVRGPRTAAALGLPAETGIVDPAVMLPTLPRFAQIERTDEVLFVPHYKSVPSYDWPAICAAAGVAYQSPSDEAEAVIRRIAGARLVIAESMHAAIIADAFGVPWRGVEITSGFNHFKWGDWAESLGMDLPPITRFFAPLRGLQSLVQRLRRAVHPKKGGAGPGGASPGGASAGDAREVRDGIAGQLAPVLKPWAIRHLRREAALPGTLSDPAAREAVRIRYRAMLDAVVRDYGARTSGIQGSGMQGSGIQGSGPGTDGTP